MLTKSYSERAAEILNREHTQSFASQHTKSVHSQKTKLNSRYDSSSRAPKMAGTAVVNDAGEEVTPVPFCNECRTKSGFIQLVIFYGLIAIFLFAFIIGIGIVISYAMSTNEQPTVDPHRPGNTVKSFIDPTMLLDDPNYQAEKIVSIYF